MIALDIPMPKNCANCPCSYYIRIGEFAGCLMCEALEHKEPEHETGFYLVDEFAPRRPEKCLMKEIVAIHDPR